MTFWCKLVISDFSITLLHSNHVDETFRHENNTDLVVSGRTKEQAMKGYISYVEELGNKYGWLLEGEKVGDSLFDDALLHSAFWFH